MQSPIKLEKIKSLPLAAPTILLSIDYTSATYQGTFKGDNPAHGNFELSGPDFPLIKFKNRDYKLLRVHIHLGSEHMVEKDEQEDFEVHFVHVPKNGSPEDHKVVIGILYERSSAKSLRGLIEFAKGIPSRDKLKAMGTAAPPSPSFPITPSKFFPLLPDGTADKVNWFHYEGSLTSFPYTEDVSWFVMQNLAAVLGTETGELEKHAEQEARGLQPLERRIVVRSFQ